MLGSELNPQSIPVAGESKRRLRTAPLERSLFKKSVKMERIAHPKKGMTNGGRNHYFLFTLFAWAYLESDWQVIGCGVELLPGKQKAQVRVLPGAKVLIATGYPVTT